MWKKVKEKFQDVYDEVVEKAENTIEDIEDVVDAAGDVVEDIKSVAENPQEVLNAFGLAQTASQA